MGKMFWWQVGVPLTLGRFPLTPVECPWQEVKGNLSKKNKKVVAIQTH